MNAFTTSRVDKNILFGGMLYGAGPEKPGSLVGELRFIAAVNTADSSSHATDVPRLGEPSGLRGRRGAFGLRYRGPDWETNSQRKFSSQANFGRASIR